MALQKKPKGNTTDIDVKAAEKFVSGALANPAKGKTKTLVQIRLDNDLLAAIDAMASRRGMTRTSLISYWCSRAVEDENKQD